MVADGGTNRVISISRQVGSGGAYIGQQLAKRLGISYLDREIITQAAKQLSVLEEDIQTREEKVPSFWQSLFQYNVYNSPDVYIPPQYFIPTDVELFRIEAEIIKRFAQEQSAVIIGRCSSYVLRGHPGHIGIFLYADNDFRLGRIQELYKVGRDEAEKIIKQSDAERSRYHHTLTGIDWNDARQYSLTVNTGCVGVENSIQLILQYLEYTGKQ